MSTIEVIGIALGWVGTVIGFVRANLYARRAKKAAAEKATVEKPAKVDMVRKAADKYHKIYPDSRKVHVASDMQVFLDDSYNMAVLHQSTLKEGKLTTVTYE